MSVFFYVSLDFVFLKCTHCFFHLYCSFFSHWLYLPSCEWQLSVLLLFLTVFYPFLSTSPNWEPCFSLPVWLHTHSTQTPPYHTHPWAGALALIGGDMERNSGHLIHDRRWERTFFSDVVFSCRLTADCCEYGIQMKNCYLLWINSLGLGNEVQVYLLSVQRDIPWNVVRIFNLSPITKGSIELISPEVSTQRWNMGFH